jgi:hypothetical protein
VLVGHPPHAVDDLDRVDPRELVEHQLDQGGSLGGPLLVLVAVLVQHLLDERTGLAPTSDRPLITFDHGRCRHPGQSAISAIVRALARRTCVSIPPVVTHAVT